MDKKKNIKQNKNRKKGGGFVGWVNFAYLCGKEESIVRISLHFARDFALKATKSLQRQTKARSHNFRQD